MEGERKGFMRKTEQARMDAALVQMHCSARGARKAAPRLELDQISGAQGLQGGNIPGLPPINYVTLHAAPVFCEPPTPCPSDESTSSQIPASEEASQGAI